MSLSGKRPPACAASSKSSGAAFIEEGAAEVIVPALWGQDTFINKAGGSDVLDQMWSFPDKKGRPVCLIPEATAVFQEIAADLLAGAPYCESPPASDKRRVSVTPKDSRSARSAGT